MSDSLRVTSAWAAVACALLGPMAAALILMYSDVEKLKATKAEEREVLEIKATFSEQMARNTTAIENLNETLRDIRGLGGK